MSSQIVSIVIVIAIGSNFPSTPHSLDRPMFSYSNWFNYDLQLTQIMREVSNRVWLYCFISHCDKWTDLEFSPPFFPDKSWIYIHLFSFIYVEQTYDLRLGHRKNLWEVNGSKLICLLLILWCKCICLSSVDGWLY